MKEYQMPPVCLANMVANSGNTTYIYNTGAESIASDTTPWYVITPPSPDFNGDYETVVEVRTMIYIAYHIWFIYIFVVVNFDALAQASDIQIERRQVVFLCWMQDLNPGSQTPNRQQTECSLTNRLSYQGSSYKLELDSPSLWSASTQPTWPHCQLTFAPGSGDIHICCCSFRCSGTGKRYSNRKETSCVPLLNAGFEPGVPDTKSPADWMLADKPTELSRIKL